MSENRANVSETKADLILTATENLLYLLIAVMLSIAAFVMLASAGWELLNNLRAGHFGEGALHLLNQLLLVLMMIELLHTVQVSLREHALVAEPFLIVALIAGVRRVLVITAEAWHLGETDPAAFSRAMLELGLITGMTLVIVVAVILLRKFKIDPQH